MCFCFKRLFDDQIWERLYGCLIKWWFNCVSIHIDMYRSLYTYVSLLLVYICWWGFCKHTKFRHVIANRKRRSINQSIKSMCPCIHIYTTYNRNHLCTSLNGRANAFRMLYWWKRQKMSYIILNTYEIDKKQISCFYEDHIDNIDTFPCFETDKSSSSGVLHEIEKYNK